jgi:preprotein translocase subunit YajC
MDMVRTLWCIAVLLFFVVMFFCYIRKAHKRTLAKEYDLYAKDLTKKGE